MNVITNASNKFNKRMKKKIIILLVICFVQYPLQAQINDIDALITICKNEVTEINNQVLYKTLVDFQGYRIGNDENFTETLTVLYFDSNNRIRKSKLLYSVPEEAGCNYRYFNEEGMAILSLYSLHSGMNFGCSTSRYLNHAGDLLCVDIIRKDDIDNALEHIVRFGGVPDLPMPYINNENYDNILNIDSLHNEIKRFYNVDSLYRPNDCIPVRFIKPQKGQSTIINANSVIIRKKPSTGGQQIGTLYVGDEVQILGAKAAWYKVMFRNKTGYVYHTFLEPVEQEINDSNAGFMYEKNKIQ
jgi:hypothetical protein